MAGYPRVIGGRYYPGLGVNGGGYVVGDAALSMALQNAANAAAQAGRPDVAAGLQAQAMGGSQIAVPVMAQPGPSIVQPPWRPMMAPGSPPLGEGHVAMPLNPETFNGTWGNGNAGAGVTITFSARPQKPYKLTRLLVTGTKSGATAIGRLIGQVFVGTDLQQGELGNIDLESLGAGGSFDTWLSLKQAEPGVWIRVQATLTAFPTGTDFEVYTITAIGHYLH